MTHEEFQQQRVVFLPQVSSFAAVHTIPSCLVLNWDQTGVNIVPSSNYTMEQRGSNRVEIAGYEDKRQITATFAATLSGEFLPMQILYAGKTDRCHPRHQFPSGFDIYHTPNHWSNEETVVQFVKKIIIPYVQETRQKLGTPDQTALVLFDVFSGQTTSPVYDGLEEANISYIHIPSGCTDQLQPLDLSVNKPAKSCLREKFTMWYADEVKKQVDAGKQAADVKVDMPLSVMKEKGAQWLEGLYAHMKASSDTIINGFKKAGIYQAIQDPQSIQNSQEAEIDDPFSDLDEEFD